MVNSLLIGSGAVVGIAAGAGGLIVVLSSLYGALRKLSKVTWIGFEIPIAFALSLLFGLIPETGNGALDFFLAAFGLLLSVGLVLGADALIRSTIFSPMRRKATKGMKVADRVLGAVASLFAVLMIFVVLGVFGLKIAECFAGDALGLGSVGVWKFFGGHAADLMLLSVLLLVMRAGFRLGLLKAVFALLFFALSVGILVAVFLFVTEVPFMRSFGITVGGWFRLHPAASAVLGCGILIFLLFAILFGGLTVGGYFLNKLIQKAGEVRPFAIVDSLIVCVLYTAVFLALVMSVYFGVSTLAGGALDGLGGDGMTSVTEGVRSVAESVASLFRSSPLSGKLYNHNLLALIFG